MVRWAFTWGTADAGHGNITDLYNSLHLYGSRGRLYTVTNQIASDMPRLPELIEYTIDYLHDSASTLCACASVCRAWVAPSHFHLFYRRSIVPTDDISEQIRELLQFLQKPPHIAHYIRDFHFSVGYGPTIRMRLLDWPSLETVLPHLLGSYENWSLSESPLSA
jgi:hypothetical protein